MIVDLKRIFVSDNASLPIEYELDMSKVDFYGSFPLKKPVKLVGSISGKASLVMLNAQMTYELDANCDRCGVGTVRTHTTDIQKVLAVSTEGEDSEDIIVVPDMKLDLEDFVYTEVVVGIPTKHLCKETCRGICVKCGRNLNEGDCGCQKQEIDPRLSALADLLNN